MKVIIQRSQNAKVLVNNEITGEIKYGLVALVGITQTDNDETIEYIANKLVNLRIFEDEDEKLNRSVVDVKGGILVVPNFTVYADTKKGMRPSFTDAAKPEISEKIFEKLINELKKNYEYIEAGVFRADMKVHLVNDGPVTVILEK